MVDAVKRSVWHNPAPMSRVKAWLRPRWPDLVILAGLAAGIALLHWPLWAAREADQMAIAPGDTTSLFYPAAVYGVEELKQGRLPLWAPYPLGGQPFAAQMQTQALYPVRWISALLHIGRPYPYASYALEVIAHLILSAWGAYLFFRRATASRAGGVALAAAWGVGGYLTGYLVQQLPLLASAAWLPWLAYGLDGALRRDRRGPWLMLAAAAWCLSLLGGMPQISAYLAALALGLAAHAALERLGTGTKAIFGPLGVAAAALALGTAWAMPLLLPAAELIRYAERANWGFAQYAGGFEVQDLFGLLWPRLTLWSPLYIGAAPLVWLLLRPARAPGAPGPRPTWVWVALLAGGALLSLGANSVVYPILYRVAPGFGLFRNQERAVIVIVWSLLMLAAARWRDIAAAPAPPAARLAWVSVAAWGALLGAARLWTGLQPEREWPRLHALLSTAAWPWLMAVMALGAVSLWRWRPSWARAGLALIAALDAGTVAWLTGSQVNWIGQDNPRYREVTQLVPWDTSRVSAARPPGRIDTRGLLGGDWTLIARVADLHGQLPLGLDGFVQFRATTPGERLWALLGVACFSRLKDEPELPFDAVTVAETMSVENKAVVTRCLRQPFDRYRVVHDARVIGDRGAAQAALRDAGFDPLKTVSVETVVAVQPASGADRVSVVAWQPQAVTLRVSAAGDGVLVAGDNWYPGWQASVDGRPVPVLRAYYAIQAVPVPGGEHEVRLVYTPSSLLAGVAIAVVALLVAAGFLVAERRLRPV